MPDINSVLASFEKTISGNEKAGVTSRMFLSNMAKQPKLALQGSLNPPVRNRRARPSSRPMHRLTRLGDLPEDKIPTDVTVATAATFVEDYDDDEAEDWKTTNDDPFAEDEDDYDDDSIHADDDGFELCSHVDEDSLQNSFASFTASQRQQVKRDPPGSRNASSSRHNSPPGAKLGVDNLFEKVHRKDHEKSLINSSCSGGFKESGKPRSNARRSSSSLKAGAGGGGGDDISRERRSPNRASAEPSALEHSSSRAMRSQSRCVDNDEEDRTVRRSHRSSSTAEQQEEDALRSGRKTTRPRRSDDPCGVPRNPGRSGVRPRKPTASEPASSEESSPPCTSSAPAGSTRSYQRQRRTTGSCRSPTKPSSQFRPKQLSSSSRREERPSSSRDGKGNSDKCMKKSSSSSSRDERRPCRKGEDDAYLLKILNESKNFDLDWDE